MSEEERRAVCPVCFHHCALRPGQTGICRARKNEGGIIRPLNAGKLTAIAMDPIEKKPFARFYPGTRILSVGSFGCNLACPFCQNHEISQASEGEIPVRDISPEQLTNLALSIPDNLGIAFTYNEPLIAWEYLRDTGKLLKEADPEKKVAVVTNGTASPEVIQAILPFVDAMNIDLKGDERFYREELRGDYTQVWDTIRAVYRRVHLEVTALIIPGKNDNPRWIRGEAEKLAGLGPEIPLHITRYFPRWKYTIPPTPRAEFPELLEEARRSLRYVYTGNL